MSLGYPKEQQGEESATTPKGDRLRVALHPHHGQIGLEREVVDSLARACELVNLASGGPGLPRKQASLVLIAESGATATRNALRSASALWQRSVPVIALIETSASLPLRQELLALGAAELVTREELLTGEFLDRFQQAIARGSSTAKLVQEIAVLRTLSTRDPLTGMFNRTFFEERLRRSICAAMRHKESVVLIVVDLGEFKQINDAMGHNCGDLLLKTVADRMTSCLRMEEQIFRIGGDEFAVLVERVQSVQVAQDLATRLLQRIGLTVEIDGQALMPSASIGAAMAPNCGSTPADLLRSAEVALYKAKQTGRNSVEVFSHEMHSQLNQRAVMQREVHLAVQRQELRLHYQPQVCSRSGRVVGIECLLRWDYPLRGLLGPDHFLDAAESAGLMEQITRFVVVTACSELREILSIFDLRVSINVSTTDLQRDSQLVDTLRKEIERNGIDPHRLEIEITEHLLIKDVMGTRETLHQLESMGIAVALDDFGVGFSSLSYLRELPISVLKIDRSFINNIENGSRDQQLLFGVLDLAKRLDIETVAEGIETKEQRDLLAGAGANRLQGYFFARPMPRDALAEHLSQSETHD